jgi:lipocalin
MKLSSAITLIASSTLLLGAASQFCKTVTSLDDFDLDQFTSAKWYSHQQRESPFQSKALFNCVTAEYSYLNPANGAQEAAGVANGYGIKVFNYSEDIDGKVYTSDDTVDESGGPLPGALCAGSQVFEGDKASEVTVGFCTFPVVSFEQSNYWVLAYDEEDGYALIAGGQTNVPRGDGLCSYGNPTAGLWIFSRSSERNEDMIEKYRGIAIDNGIDPSIMEDVSHVNCDGNEPPSGSKKSKKSKSKKSKSKKTKSSKGS